jgi:DNA modification methylase
MTGLNLDTIECADVMDYLRGLPDACVNLVCTSPPYFNLRSYLQDGHEDKAREIGTEQTPAAYVARMVDVFREVKRVLRPDGNVYVNLASSWSSGVVVDRVNEPFVLRDDLTPEEITYVLSELAAFRKEREIGGPVIAVGVDETVTPLASGKEV